MSTDPSTASLAPNHPDTSVVVGTSARGSRTGNSPISKVPPEILSYIFSFVSAPSYDSSSFTPSFPDCFAVSQVCRLWREIAFECPLLWTDLPQQHLSLTKRALELTRDYPISIRAFTSRADDTNWGMNTGLFSLGKDVLPFARHVVAGHREIRNTDNFKNLRKALDRSPAPMLESLTVVYSRFDHRTLCGEVPSRLQRLVLISSNAKTSTSCFKSPITELALVSTIITEEQDPLHPRYPPAIAVLSRLPDLRRLFFKAAATNFEGALPENDSEYLPASLPKLQYLCIDDAPSRAGFLLSWLHMPLSTVFNIRTHTFGSITAPYELATYPLTIISKYHLRRHTLDPSASYTSLRLALLPEDTYQTPVVGCSLVLSKPIGDSGLAPFFVYSICAGTRGAYKHPINGLSPILRALPLTSRLREFEFDHPLFSLSLFAEEKMWIEMSDIFPSVQRIAIPNSTKAATVLLSTLEANHIFAQLTEIELRQATDAMAPTIQDLMVRRPRLKFIMQERRVSVLSDWIKDLQGVFVDRVDWMGPREPREDSKSPANGTWPPTRRDEDLFDLPRSITTGTD